MAEKNRGIVSSVHVLAYGQEKGSDEDQEEFDQDGETVFVLFLAVLKNSVLPKGWNSSNAKLKVRSDL